jgi:hypothetical protein
MERYLILAVELPLPGAEQFKLGPGGHKTFDGGQHLHEVRPVSCDESCAHLRAPVLVVVTHLSD